MATELHGALAGWASLIIIGLASMVVIVAIYAFFVGDETDRNRPFRDGDDR